MNPAPARTALALALIAVLLLTGSAAGARPVPEPAAPGATNPMVVSYQGHVILNGGVYSGVGYFKFAVVNASGATTYWSSDANKPSGTPGTSVTLNVSSGLFTVMLGDTLLTNMNSLPPTAFAAADTYLRVWFSPDNVTFTQITPDRRIAAAPYALRADLAATASSAATAASATNADTVDGAHAGNGNGNVALNNLTLNTNLNADRLDGQHREAFQQRVAGACAVGSTVRAVNADGTVVCEAHYTRAGFSRRTVDATGDVGLFTSITIGVDGLPVISYQDGANYDLKVLHCGDAACATGNTSRTVDADGTVGQYSSITIGADGLPVISYYDNAPNYDLKVLHCGDAACTTGNTITTVDSGGMVGEYSSIAIGADGLPVISYLDYTNGDLKVLHCGDAACTAGNTITPVDTANSVGNYSSITIGADGLPVISYDDNTSFDLKVLHCGDLACTTGNTATTVDSAGNVGTFTSITIGTDGLPVISYHDWYANYNLKVLHCGNATCTSGNTITTVDAGGYVGTDNAITIGADGLPFISYAFSDSYDLRVLHCGNAACSSGNTITTVDAEGHVGSYTSVTIGADGLPVVSYQDDTNDDLKVLRCGNATCVPYFGRR